MAANSGGTSHTKRKFAPEDMERNDVEPSKKPQKYVTTKRGVFKDYTPIYKEDLKEYPILLSDVARAKLDLLRVNKTLTKVPGILHIKPIGLFYIKIFFKEKTQANSFLLNSNLMLENKWSAKIPYNNIESQGIIRVPVEISEEELLESLQSSVEILGVKRFQKKQADGSFLPLRTVLITFLSCNLPDHVTFEHIWFDVSQYVRPLLQCFTCYKFNHSSGSCKSQQLCSICAGQHSFKECINQENLKCINCSGPHAAVAYVCPVKSAKHSEIKNKIAGKISYASVTAKPNVSIPTIPSQPHVIPLTQTSKPSNITPKKRSLIVEILNSDMVLNSITKTITDLIMKKQQQGSSINCNLIKEALISNFSSSNNG